MTIPRENLANAVAFLVGFSLLPVTFAWCGGNIGDLPPQFLLISFPMGIAGAGIVNAYRDRM